LSEKLLNIIRVKASIVWMNSTQFLLLLVPRKMS